MAKGCGHKCAKYFLFVLNVLFFIAGCVILGVGVWARVDKRLTAALDESGDLDSALSASYVVHTAAAVFIAFGAFVFVVGGLGCLGAIRESKCLLGFYITFVVIVVIGELAAGIFAAIRFKAITSSLSDAIVNDLKLNYPLSKLNDTVMREFACCGWNSYQDFEGSNFTRSQNQTVVPTVCCSGENASLIAQCNFEARSHSAQPKVLIAAGCKDTFVGLLRPFTMVFIGVAVGLAVLELVVLVAAITLCIKAESD